MNRMLRALGICLLAVLPCRLTSAQIYEDVARTRTAARAEAGATTQIVFLGTGMPAPNPQRQGPAFVIETGGNTYLVDIGVGVMRQAAAAHVDISPPTAAFLSHLHTDHTLGLPDLMFTAWSANGAKSNFPLYGPVGLQWMVTNIQNAYTQDICVRNVCQMFGKNNYQPPTVHEIELKYPTGGPTPPPSGSHAPICNSCAACPSGKDCTCGAELPKSAPQVVYSDSAVTVSAFLVRHGCWDEALGYVFETTADKKKIVYSGDTRYVANMGAACSGCDVLVHELYWGKESGPACGSYMTCFHTTVPELQQVFKEGNPKKLVVVHQVGTGTPETLGIPPCSTSKTSGCVIFANDLETVTP